MTDETGGLRAALEAAYDAQEGTDTAEPVVESPVEAAPEPTPDATDTRTAAERARDEQGRFAKQDKPAEPQTGTKEPVKAKPPEVRRAPLTAADTQPQPDAPQQVKAPASWRPSEREAWGQVPKAAQEAIARREREIEAGMREASDARQNWSRFQEVIEPFKPIMLANGSTDPVQSAQNLFRTAAVLQTGTPYQKAGMLAQVMAQFDIDPRMVAAYVSGQMPQGMPQQEPLRDPRVDQLLSRLEQAKAQKQQAFEAKMAQTIEDFSSKAEWFEDVREQMADIIDLWDRQGKVDESNLTDAIKNAYDMAVQLNPDIAQAMRQRQQVSQVQTAQANVQRAQNAASSVRGQPTVGGTAPPKDRREALEQAYDARMNRRA